MGTGVGDIPGECLKVQNWGQQAKTALLSFTELKIGRAKPCSPRTLPKKEYSSRTVSWAHFLHVSEVSLEKPSISICKMEITNLPLFSMVTVKTNLEVSQKQSVSTATVTT